mmetsp:Transcript_17229/g.31003  ORF Transcript_17229/g.31003 Transcript_17229/m.31003 type:complete len:274 (+) Transcript_17229:8164-8985(+)
MSSDDDASGTWVNIKSLRNAAQVSSIFKTNDSSRIPSEQKANSKIHSSPSFSNVHRRYHSFVDEFINPDDTMEDMNLLKNYKKLATLLQQRVLSLEQSLHFTKRKLAHKTEKYRVKLQLQQERHETRMTHVQKLLMQRDYIDEGGRGSFTERPQDEISRLRREFEARLNEESRKNEQALASRDQTIANLESRLKNLEAERKISEELKRTSANSPKPEESLDLVEEELRDILGQINKHLEGGQVVDSSSSSQSLKSLKQRFVTLTNTFGVNMLP